MAKITLTGKMIKELAEFAHIEEIGERGDALHEESEYTISSGIDGEGVAVKEEDGSETFYPFFVYCNECPDEGGIGLGEAIAKPDPEV